MGLCKPKKFMENKELEVIMKRSILALIGTITTIVALSLLYTNMSRPLQKGHAKIYVSTRGSDTKDGTSSNNSVATLKRAHQLAAAYMKRSPIDVVVYIEPGTYYNQTVTWTTAHPKYYTKITTTNPKKQTVFDGRANRNASLGSQRSFFTFRFSGQHSNLIIENLTIRNYAEGITLSGNREDFEKGWNGSNKILNNTFDRIGSLYHEDPSKHAYAVLRLVNSRYNEIRGNKFTNIMNKKSPALLHSIYAANASSHNIIHGNHFGPQKGDPVRIRDFSNFNDIAKNTFDRAAAYGYSEWYCEKKSNSACSKGIPECPSWGNVFKNNTLTKTGVWHLYVNAKFVKSKSACQRNPPKEADNRRLRTSQNISKK